MLHVANENHYYIMCMRLSWTATVRASWQIPVLEITAASFPGRCIELALGCEQGKVSRLFVFVNEYWSYPISYEHVECIVEA